MMKSIGAAIALALLSACAGAAKPATSAAVADVPDARFVELGLDEFSSPFTKETVLKLNAVVGRSLAAIREYDGAIREIQESINAALADGAPAEARAKARKGLANVERLSGEATAARADMSVAEAELKSRGETYNKPILAGMVGFVVKVDEELREASEDLAARLGAE